MSIQTVNEVSEISQIYPESSLEKQKQRFNSLFEKFKSEFGYEADFIARAPGRVNLIGEHVDYSGYPVLPMAIEQDTLMAVGTKEGEKAHIQLSNVSAEKFPTMTFDSTKLEDVEINKKHNWSNYFVCGFKGILEEVKASKSVSLDLMVDGKVPIGSGLSSSSALVCASAIAVMRANEFKIDKTRLASLCAECERYMGLQSGGMDQAISILAEKGTAKLIEFNPLVATDVLLPEKACFVIANCLVESNKYATAGSGYNMRVAETKLASLLLAKKMNLENWENVNSLSKVQNQSGLTLIEMSQKVKSLLEDKEYNLEEISKELDVSLEKVGKEFIQAEKVGDKFKVYKRALHVYEESQRVQAFKQLCDEKQDQEKQEEQLLALGKLMNESHSSCKDLFGCSCDELDLLTSICREEGALGSRLTGAGWGGWSVALVRAHEAQQFMEKVKQRFYKGGEGIQITKPGKGACVFRKSDK